MADPTREQIEKWLHRARDGHALRLSKSDGEALCAMALRALDTGWQPMSTAPKDGTLVLVACVGLYRQIVETSHWDGEFKSWETNDGRTIHPDAWMPLPPPFTGDAKTLDDRAAQRRSFAAGNVAIDRDPDARRTVAVKGVECAACEGSGYVTWVDKCPDCNGTGRAKGGEHG